MRSFEDMLKELEKVGENQNSLTNIDSKNTQEKIRQLSTIKRMLFLSALAHSTFLFMNICEMIVYLFLFKSNESLSSISACMFFTLVNIWLDPIGRLIKVMEEFNIKLFITEKDKVMFYKKDKKTLKVTCLLLMGLGFLWVFRSLTKYEILILSISFSCINLNEAIMYFSKLNIVKFLEKYFSKINEKEAFNYTYEKDIG